MSHRCRIMKKPQAPPVRRRRRPRQGSSSETRPCRVLTGRVRNPGGGGGGRAREAGRGGGVFRVLAGVVAVPGARVRDAGRGGGVFRVLAGGSPGGGGKGLNRGFGGCTDRDAFAVPSAVAALCRPCSSGGAFQQLLAPGRLPAAYPRPLGDNHPNLPLPVYRIPGRVVNRAGRLRRRLFPGPAAQPFPHPAFSAETTQLNSMPNLPAGSVGSTPGDAL